MKLYEMYDGRATKLQVGQTVHFQHEHTHGSFYRSVYWYARRQGWKIKAKVFGLGMNITRTE